MNLAQAILKRIQRHGQPRVFTPKDFLDLGTPHAVGMTLLRLVRNNGIRWLARGLYDSPKKHPVLGLLSPPVEAIAEALAGRDGTRIQPSGAYAANLLHLSEQVPAKIVYHTDGTSRQVRIGKQTIILKHAAPSRLRAHNRMSGLVIQALRYLGKTHVTEDRVLSPSPALAKPCRIDSEPFEFFVFSLPRRSQTKAGAAGPSSNFALICVIRV